MKKLFENCNILDVKEKKFFNGNLLVENEKIIGINVKDIECEKLDLKGSYIVPGFIDGHIHLESSIITPDNFAKLVAFHGTTAVVTDPHEIANVCGINGIKWMMQKTKNLPIDVYFVVPSCVPATPFDESAYTLDSENIKEIFSWNDRRILGLAEVMNYPSVIYQDEDLMKKIKYAKDSNKIIDGHAPGLTGQDLIKYIKAGIMSDHECSTYDEAKEKLDVAKNLNQKFYIMIREGTAAKNLNSLVKLLSEEKYIDNLMFATDDKHPEEINKEGHIDNIIKKAINLGVKPEIAYTVASYNAANYFGLKEIGSIEVNKEASFVILEDLNTCKIEKVYKKGKLIEEKEYINEVDKEIDKNVRNAINMTKLEEKNFRIEEERPIIELVPKEIITKYAGATKNIDINKDIIKIAVIESHKGTMHTQVAYLKGMGLKEGAIGTTVAHDSHYMILAGTNDKDLAYAANEISKMQGGKIVVKNGMTIEKLPLPIANLMTNENPDTVIKQMEKLKQSVSVNENIDPFMNLSFVSLAVIPDIRLLPKGVFDVKKWKFFE